MRRLAAFVVRVLCVGSVRVLKVPLADGLRSGTQKQSRANQGFGELDVLSLTYNHGEACETSLANRAALVARVRGEINRASSQPGVVAMSSQELRSDDWSPLEEAVRGLPYVIVGGSDISGITKFFCSYVETEVKVALHKDLASQALSAIAEECGGQVRCKEGKSNLTRGRFYTVVKATKGHVAVHLQLGALQLRFVSAHLDTGEFEQNLRDYTGPALGQWESVAPGVTIVGADFNNRVGDSAESRLCGGPLTTKTMESVFNVSSSTFNQDMRLTNVEKLLQSGARSTAGASLLARLVPPSTRNGAALPTYKFPTTTRSLGPEEVLSRAEVLFGAGGTNVCKKSPPSFGVLDSVASVYDPKRFSVQERHSIWSSIPGSDHALVGALLRVQSAP